MCGVLQCVIYIWCGEEGEDIIICCIEIYLYSYIRMYENACISTELEADREKMRK